MDSKSLYEKLGAVWFQGVVFKVEKLKFKFIDKFCPNIDKLVDKYLNYRMKKELKKCKNDKEKSDVMLDYNCRKLSFKKEMIEKKNINYHINESNASSFYNFLEKNKQIHVRNMIKDIICINGCLVLSNYLSGLYLGLATAYMIYNIVALGVDFQCINLQNYNMCRFLEKERVLTKIETRKKLKDVRNYSNVSSKIYKKLSSRIEVPSEKEMVSSLDTLQELDELRRLVLEVKKSRGITSDSSTIDKNLVKEKKV